jgi:pilus assembly protein CpaC
MIRLSTDSICATARHAFAALLFVGVLCGAWHEGYASKTDLVTIADVQQKRDPTLVLTQGKADIVEVDGPVSDIMVADPSVVDVMVLQANRLYMVGSALGSTNVIALDGEGNVIKRLNVRVKIDDGTIQDLVQELFPDEQVKITTMADQVVLTGEVSTPDVSNRLINVVSRYVAQEQGGGSGDISNTVVNMLTVAGEQQVMLRVKIVEASRDTLRELGVATGVSEGEPGGEFNNVAGFLGAAATGLGLSADPLGTANVIYDHGSGLGPIQVVIDALEQNGLLNTLAEPNLTAISGQEAGFLAGGEFPIPASRDQDGNIVIDYRPFGVALNFRPTVMSPDRISLQLQTEVSSISNQNSLNINQLNVPGFSVRRAQTTVELASGGSLMIAGLLRSDATRTMTDLPGIKDVPILGDLISSDSFQREESELVVMVTAYLVTPFADKSQAEESVSPARVPLAEAFQNNIRRVYNRRPLDGLFDGEQKYGYLID